MNRTMVDFYVELLRDIFQNLEGAENFINPIQEGLFRGCSRMGGKKDPLPKICHTYAIMLKLGTVLPYLKKIQKLYAS